MRHLSSASALLSLLLSVTAGAQSVDRVIDAAGGRPLHPTVLGHNWSFYQEFRLPQYTRSLRGVAAGLNADTYDWKRRTGVNAAERETTLEYLRACRDNGWMPMVTANVRGITAADGDRTYTDTSAQTLAQLAGDWVYYTNHILPRYRQGDTIDDPRAQRILAELQWGDHDTLLAPGEPVTPRVVYWQIGNEPVASAGRTPDGKTLRFNNDPEGYVRNYRAIAESMAAADDDLRIGPCFSGGDARAINKPDRAFARHLFASDARIDFITYQPYMHLQEKWPDVRAMAEMLQSARAYVIERHHDPLMKALVEAGRDPKQIQIGVSEYNATGWHDSSAQTSMARALGVAEMFFAMAELDYVVGSMWDPMGVYGITWPVYDLSSALYDHLGNILVDSFVDQSLRVYTTRDNQTGQLAVWLINLDPEAARTVTLQFENTGPIRKAVRRTLGDRVGQTSPLDRNTMLRPDHVGWTDAQDITSTFTPESFTIVVQPMEIDLLVADTQIRPVVLSRSQAVQRVPAAVAMAQEQAAATSGDAVAPSGDIESPDQPTDLAVETTPDGVLLRWKPVGGQVDRYVIERSFDAIDYPRVGEVPGDQAQFVDSSAEPGVTYRYRVEAVNAGGGSGPSDLVYVTIPGAEEDKPAALPDLDVAILDATQPTIGHWPLNSEHGLRDVSSNKNHAEPHGDPAFDTVDGREAIVLDGDGDYLEVADPPHVIFGPGYEATFSCWMRTTADGVLFSRNLSYHGPGKSEFNLLVLGDGTLRWTGGSLFRGHKPVQGFSQRKVNDGRWHHVAVVLRHDQATFYIDGEPDASWQLDWVLPHRISMLIGARRLTSTQDIGNFFAGAIADVRMEQRALTAAELRERLER